MTFKCKILLDSISETGKRLTTFEITFPRIILSEFNTHRAFSRNSASSRAIPFKKMVDKVSADPFIPEKFPVNIKGMQPQEYITKNDSRYEQLEKAWLSARRTAVTAAEALYDLGNIHKQICNRLLEPFMWHTVIVTATEFDNFFKLRTHPDAQYEIKRIADLMYEAYHAWDNTFIDNPNKQRPQKLKVGEWHCPLAQLDDEEEIKLLIDDHYWADKLIAIPYSQQVLEVQKRISVARCARVSYLTHDGKRDIEKDLELFERLKNSGHWSPFEHVATPYFVSQDGNYPRSAFQTIQDKNIGDNIRSANFVGWKQYRKEFSDENCTKFRKENN